MQKAAGFGNREEEASGDKRRLYYKPENCGKEGGKRKHKTAGIECVNEKQENLQ